MFFKAIYEMWVACKQYAELSVEDVKDEIFDLVQPADPFCITLHDLLVRLSWLWHYHTCRHEAVWLGLCRLAQQ